MTRRCRDCPADISHRSSSAQRCEACAIVRRRHMERRRREAKHAGAPQQEKAARPPAKEPVVRSPRGDDSQWEEKYRSTLHERYAEAMEKRWWAPS